MRNIWVGWVKPWLPQAVKCRRSLTGILPQHLPNQVLQIGRIAVKLRRKNELGSHDIVYGFAMILGLKGSMSGNEFVNHDSGRPYIYFFCVSSASKHFWCSVIKSASDGEHLKFSSPPPVFSAYSIVYKFQFFSGWVIQYIFWFDISVTHCSLMQIM